MGGMEVLGGRGLVGCREVMVGREVMGGVGSFQTFRSLRCSAGLGGRAPPELREPEKPKKQLKMADFYRRTNIWSMQEKLTKHLFANILYHEPEQDRHGLVVLNKPYGLPLRNSEDSAYSLESSMESLASLLEVDQLYVLKTAERWNSGITVLATSEKTRDAYVKCLARMQTKRVLSSSYLAISKGHSKLSRTETVDVRMVECPHVNNPVIGNMHKEPEISRKALTQHAAFREAVKKVHVHCATLANSSKVQAGLTELLPSSTANNFPQVYMADAGFPILGDQLYDYRARAMLGHKLKLTTAHAVATKRQVLAPALLEVLGLRKGEEWQVPRMVHYHRLHLDSWLGKNTHITVFAPPPPHFQLTCDELGISLDYKALAEEDEIRSWQLDTNKARRKKKAVAVQEIVTVNHTCSISRA